jgi:hypothetical protein
MKTRKENTQWLYGAFRRVKVMEKAENEMGLLSPEQIGIHETISCISEAIDACINFASKDQLFAAREIAEEAIIMAMTCGARTMGKQ